MIETIYKDLTREQVEFKLDVTRRLVESAIKQMEAGELKDELDILAVFRFIHINLRAEAQ